MSEEESPKKFEKRRIIDVEDPDKSAPSATSKPVLVSNRPILKDPMVTEDDNKTEADATPEKQELKRSSRPTIQPPDRPETDSSHDQPKPAELKESPAQEASKPAAAAQETAEKPSGSSPAGTGAETPETAPPSEARNPDFDPSTQDKGKPKTDAEKKLQAEAAERAKHDDMIQKLTEGGQYTLPIHSTEQQRTKQFILLGAILVAILVLAWLDIALDAHIISLGGLHPLTHFFTN